MVVMVHGWGDSSATFNTLRDQLASRYTILTLDLPGFGQSQQPEIAWNLDNYAGVLRDLLARLQLQPRAFVAHSNGGSVVIRGLAQGVLKSDKLVLVASAGIRDRQKLQRVILKAIAKVGKLATFWLPAHQKKSLQKWLYGAAGSDMLVAPHMQETFKLTVRQDVQDDARQLQLPTLLLYGDSDKATPPLYGDIYAKLIKNSTLHVLPGADHFLHQQHTDQVAKLIKEFL